MKPARQSLLRRVVFRVAPQRRRNGGSKRPHEGKGDRLFASGTPVPETGIYEVIHAREHRPAHEVLMLRAEAFPQCEHCGAQVRFRVVRTAPYIFDDEDFSEQE
jgi:hypothetical protein